MRLSEFVLALPPAGSAVVIPTRAPVRYQIVPTSPVPPGGGTAGSASRIDVNGECVAWADLHAMAANMSNARSSTGTVDVDGVKYDWQLQREPQWSDDNGWKGMTVSLLRRDTQRAALLEFPPPKRLLKGLQRGRLQLDDATVSRGVRAALLAGWEPMSRGKPMVFSVDAEGH